jgi:fatty-acyl-CoA synthase
MYDVSLSESLFPAIKNGLVEKITIGDLLRRQSQLHADSVALREIDCSGSTGRTWTYEQLLTDCERLGHVLASRHLPKARIAIFANNVPEWVLVQFAAALAGLTLVTVNPALQKRELRYLLEQSGAEAIYYVDEFRGNPIKAIADEVCRELPGIRHRVLLTDRAALFAGQKTGVLPQVSPDDIAQIQYTSGTTGLPKGVLLHHHGLVQNSHDTMQRFGLSSDDTFMHFVPMFHTTGCAVAALGALGVGGTILLAPVFDPEMIVRVIERERPGFMVAVPTMLTALVDAAMRSGVDVSSIRRILSGGAFVAPELANRVEAVFGATVQVGLGQTECSPIITMAWHDDSLANRTQTIGQPLPNVDVAILDPRTGAVLPVGEQGEICTRGYHVMAGYNDDPEATAKAIDAEGWLHTGDLGSMNSCGYLRITGRVKDMIIRGGENLFPAEIENILLEHEDLSEVAVVGVPCPVFGEQVACFMRARGTRRPAAAELKAFIRERLSPQKTPQFWIWIDQWPMTGSGKIRKFVLVEQFGRGEHSVLRI